jgi:tetratricopeptide (TPR) repeat protein
VARIALQRDRASVLCSNARPRRKTRKLRAQLGSKLENVFVAFVLSYQTQPRPDFARLETRISLICKSGEKLTMRDIDQTMPRPCRRIHTLAERDPRRAVALARRAIAGVPDASTADHAWARYVLGWSLLCWERFDAARSELAIALAAFETFGVEVAVLQCTFALAIADLLQFSPDDLAPKLDALAAKFDAIGTPLEALRCRLYRAVLFNMLGQTQAAEITLAQTEQACMAAGPLDRARWLRVAAVAAIARGNAAQAIEQLQQAEAIFAAAHQPLERAKTWFQHAWALLSQEQLDAALPYYEQAERLFTRLDLPQRQAWCAKNIGLLLTRRGHYDAALQALLRAIAMFRRLGSLVDVAGCQLNLGNIYFYAGLWEAALACYARAEEWFTRAGVRGERLVARRNRAIVYRMEGRAAAAAELLAAVEAEAIADGNRAELAACWHEQAELLAHAGKRADAQAGYWRARELFAAIGNWLGAADCAVDQGWLALEAGEVAEAQSHFAFAAPIVTQHPNDRWRNEYGLARCAVAGGDTQAALAHYRAALEIVAELRQRLASEETSSRIFAQAALLHADALWLAAAHGPPELAIEISEWQRALAFKRMLSAGTALPAAFQAEHDHLRATIDQLLASDAGEPEARAQMLDATLTNYGELLLHARHSTTATFDGLDGSRLDLDQLRRMLGDMYGADWTAVVFIPSDRELLTGVITPGDCAIVHVPYDSEFDRLIEQAVKPMYRRYVYRDLPYLQGQASSRWQILRQLGERLLPPAARARLHPDHHLLIVPAGPLHGLPWGALRVDNAWLAERAVVQIAPSLMTWMSLAERSVHDRAALLVGCSEFGARAPALSAVQAELAAITQQSPDRVDQLLDRQATRATLIERSAHGELAGYGLLHIATHASMLPQRGLAAHLKLWDGDLLVAEIANLRLAGCLVVLSACDGAAADTLPGEELISLSWAFLVAGAGGVLASLWRVEDHEAARLMEAFYAELWECHDPAIALARAQRSLIGPAEAGDAAGPEYWASFVLTGSGRLRV